MKDINLRKAIKTEDFKNYWAYQERKFWPLRATKETMTFYYDDGTPFASFKVKVASDEELTMVMVYCNDEEITIKLELDPFNCTDLEIVKCCAYYFYSRF